MAFLIGCAHLTSGGMASFLSHPKPLHTQVCRVMSLIFLPHRKSGKMQRDSSRVAGQQRPAPQTLELRLQVILCSQAACSSTDHKSPPGYPSWGCMLAAELSTRIFQGGVSDSQELPSEYASELC